MESATSTVSASETICYHCNDALPSSPYTADNHQFCCNACKQVYLLLSSHELGQYYQQGTQAGVKPSEDQYYFEQFDLPELQQKWVTFQEGSTVKIELHLPQIHCASCIYLLEHLNKLSEGILFSSVNFPNKTASIAYDSDRIKLSELAKLLTKIGYTPDFSGNHSARNVNKRLLLQLGVAGFAFGSIMLWSFPEYLGIDYTYFGVRNLSSWLSLLVSVPVLLYSAQDYFKAALGAFRTRHLNLDVPITIGIIALYVRSCYAIFNQEGPGYMDSFAGFIFFLLIGKWFQGKTYQWLAFDRDYRSYFPVAILKKNADELTLTPIESLAVHDRIVVRNDEIIPADSILVSAEAFIDYSFVTGESEWTRKQSGEVIYAGGKLCGEAAEFEVQRTTSRSGLIQLWNDQEPQSVSDSFVIRQDRIASSFISAVLFIATASAAVWWFIEPSAILSVITAVLIVACPCALALSGPFTFGNMLRKLGKHGFYLRSATIIEKLQQVDTIVFDKTGTLSEQASHQCDFHGDDLTSVEVAQLLDLTRYAVHPYSKTVHQWLLERFPDTNVSTFDQVATEYPGQGISDGNYFLGKAAFCNVEQAEPNESRVYWSIKGEFRGYFQIESVWRPGIDQVVQALAKHYPLVVLSGDKGHDRQALSSFFPATTMYYFNQQPSDKKARLEQLNASGKRTLMIGDGLNDAGALQSAFVGIALSEDLVRFTPASDAILKADHLIYLDQYLDYVRHGKNFVKYCFLFSLSYNLTGIGFAVTNTLTPFVAAIIMPLSSITVVALASYLSLHPKLPGKLKD